jgi:hypothetical protein
MLRKIREKGPESALILEKGLLERADTKHISKWAREGNVGNFAIGCTK